MRIMEHPLDLDEFAPDQVDITNEMDYRKKDAVYLISAALSCTRAMKLVAATMPIGHLQRACFEATRLGKLNGAWTLLGEILWAWVQALQTESVMAHKGIKLPKVREALGRDLAEEIDRIIDQDQ